MSTILHKIAKSGVHILVGAKSGNGGTTTLLGLIKEIYEIYPECQFFIISPLNQRKWLGLEHAVNEVDGKVDGEKDESAIYPAVVYPFGIDVNVAIAQIEAVHKILIRRQKTSIENSRVELIINEWSSLFGALQQCERDIYNSVLSMLGEIIRTGQEFNIRVVLESQSIRVGDTGITSELRANFATLVQERTNKDHPCKEISKEMEANSVVLNGVLSDIHRNATEKYQFVAFVFNFDKPVIEVLPDLSHLRDTVLFGQ